MAQVQYYGGRDPRANRNYDPPYAGRPEPPYQRDVNRNSWSDQRPPQSNNPDQYRMNGNYYEQDNVNNSEQNYHRRDPGYDENYNRGQFNNSYQSNSHYTEPSDRRPQYNENVDRNYSNGPEYNDDRNRPYQARQDPPPQREYYGQDYRQPDRSEFQPQSNVPPRQEQQQSRGYNQGEPPGRNQPHESRYNEYQRNYDREREQRFSPPPQAPPPPTNYNQQRQHPAPNIGPRSPPAVENRNVGQPQVLAQTTATSRGGAAVFGIVAKVGRPETTAPPPPRENQPPHHQQQPQQQYNQPYREDDNRERSPVRAHSLAPIMEQPSPPHSPRYRREPQYSEQNQHQTQPHFERTTYDRPHGRKPDDYYNERHDGFREDSSGYGSASTYNERPYDDRTHYDQQQRMPPGGGRDYANQPKPNAPPVQQGYTNQREENYGRGSNWNEGTQDQQPTVFHQQNLPKRHWTLQKKPVPDQKPVNRYPPHANNRDPGRDSGVDKTHVKSVQAAKHLFDKPSASVPLPAPKAAYIGNQYSSTGGGSGPQRPRINSDPDRNPPLSPTHRPYRGQMPDPPQHISQSMNNLDRLQPPPSMPPQSRNSYSGDQPMVVGVRFENDSRQRQDQPQRERQSEAPVEHHNQSRPVYNHPQDTRPPKTDYNQPRQGFEPSRPELPRDYNQPPRQRSPEYGRNPPKEQQSHLNRLQDQQPRSPDYRHDGPPQISSGYQDQQQRSRSPPYQSYPPPRRSQSPPFQGQQQAHRPPSPVYQSQGPQRSRSPPYQGQPPSQRPRSPPHQRQGPRPRSHDYPNQALSEQGRPAENRGQQPQEFYPNDRQSNNFSPPSSQYQTEREPFQPRREPPSQYRNQYQEPRDYNAGSHQPQTQSGSHEEPRQFPVSSQSQQTNYQSVHDAMSQQANSHRNSYVNPQEGDSRPFVPPPRPGSPTCDTLKPRSAPQVTQQRYNDQREAHSEPRQVRFQQPRSQTDRFEEAQRQQSPDSEVSNYVPSIVSRSYASYNQGGQEPRQKAPARPATEPAGNASDQQWPDPPPPITQTTSASYQKAPKLNRNEENRSQYQTRQPPPGRDNNRILTNVPRHPFDPVDEDDDSSEGIDVDAPTPPPQPPLPKQWGSNQQIARRPDMQQRHVPAGEKQGYDRQPGDGLNEDRFESNRPQKSFSKIPPNKPMRQSLRRNVPKQIPQATAPKPESTMWQDNDENDSQLQLNHDHSKDRLRVAKSGRMLNRKPPTRQGSSSNLLAGEEESQDFAIEVTPNDLRKIRESPITVQEPSPEKPQAKAKSSLKNKPQQSVNPYHASGDSRQKKPDDKANSKLIFKVPSPETAKRPTAHPLPDLKEPVEGDKKKPPTYTGFGNTVGKPKGNIGSDLLDQFKSARDNALRNAAKKQDRAMKAISGFQQKRNPSPVKSPTRKPETVADKNASKIIKNAGHDENKDIYNRSKPKHYDRNSPDDRSNRTSVKSSSTITARRDSDSSSDHRGRSTRDRGRSRARSRSRDRDLSPSRHRGRSRSRERLDSPDRRRGRSRSRERIMSPDRRGRSPSRERNVSPSRRRRDHSRDRDLDRDQRSRKSDRYHQQVSPYKQNRDDPPYRSSHHNRGGSDEPEWVEQYRRRRNHHDEPQTHRRAWVNDPRWQAKKEFDINEYERDVKRATSYNSDFEQPQRNQMFPAKLMQKSKAPPSRHPPSKNDDWMRNLKEQNRKAAQKRF